MSRSENAEVVKKPRDPSSTNSPTARAGRVMQVVEVNASAPSTSARSRAP